MPGFISDSRLARDLIRIGDEAIAREDAPALVREQIIVDGNFLAARTTFSGDFTGVFTYSPVGPVEPTGQHLEWELIGTFRYDDEGRLAEEWVQTDYRSFLTKLGVTTTERAPQGTHAA
jgi:predicted ester cyclase